MPATAGAAAAPAGAGRTGRTGRTGGTGLGLRDDLGRALGDARDAALPHVALHHLRQLVVGQRGLGQVHDDGLAGAPEGAQLGATPARLDRLARGDEDAHRAALDRRAQLLAQRGAGLDLGRVPERHAAQLQRVGDVVELGLVLERVADEGGHGAGGVGSASGLHGFRARACARRSSPPARYGA
jgi:hypothetical protein